MHGRVQSKVQALQDQLSDALGDLSMARRREEALKAEVTVAGAKLEDRGTELAKAQVHVPHGKGQARTKMEKIDTTEPRVLMN